MAMPNVRSVASLAGLAAVLSPLPLLGQQQTPLAERDRPLPGEPTNVWSVGAEEGESWQLLSNVGSMAFDANDNLYALDVGNFRVLVFDARGKFVRQIGKQGGGPGEFQFPMALAITSSGDLVVMDMGKRGFSIFAPDGTYRTHVPFPTDVGTPMMREIHAHPQGGLIARSQPTIPQDAQQLTGKLKSPIYRMTLDEKPARTDVFSFEVDPPTVSSPRPGMRMVMYRLPTFASNPSWGVLPDGRIVAQEDESYAIRIHNPAGQHVRTLTRPFAARPVTSRDQNDARERLREQLKAGAGQGVRISQSRGGGRGATFSMGTAGGGELTEAQIEQQVREMEFADRVPAIRSVTVDAVGHIWVERNPERVRDPAPVDLIAADGRYIGTRAGLEVPRAVSRSGLAAWVEKDELDVEKIVVRRLPAEWR